MAVSLASSAEQRVRSKALLHRGVTMDAAFTANAKRERSRVEPSASRQKSSATPRYDPGASQMTRRRRRDLPNRDSRMGIASIENSRCGENLPSSGYRACSKPCRGNPRLELRDYPGRFTHGPGLSRLGISMRCRMTLCEIGRAHV